jgi:hypothetical protein
LVVAPAAVLITAVDATEVLRKQEPTQV